MENMKLLMSIFHFIILVMFLQISAVAAEEALPLTEKSAAQLIAEQSGHKVLSTNVDKDDTTLFRVKTLSEQGHVKTYHVDSITGQILK